LGSTINRTETYAKPQELKVGRFCELNEIKDQDEDNVGEDKIRKGKMTPFVT
jgi:hypothetical protein